MCRGTIREATVETVKKEYKGRSMHTPDIPSVMPMRDSKSSKRCLVLPLRSSDAMSAMKRASAAAFWRRQSST